MFAPVVLPIQITFFLMVALAFALTFAFRRFTNQPVLASFGACCALGIPILFLVGAIVDSFRYGKFLHPDASKLNDGYVQLPADATEITLHKYASGHELKFTTNKIALETWMDSITEKRRRYTDATPFVLDQPSDNQSQEFADDFRRHGWKYPNDAVKYRGWRSARGGGFDVWYSESEHLAFIRAGYW